MEMIGNFDGSFLDNSMTPLQKLVFNTQILPVEAL